MLKEELESYVKKVVGEAWESRSGQKIPIPADLALKNSAVELEAAVLYADLAGSTKMVASTTKEKAAEIYKSYLYCASKLIRSHGGEITAYDGDRVMGVFIGDSKCSNAAKCALRINWATKTIVNAELKSFYGQAPEVEQRVGIDVSKLFVARTGIRGNNDLVWVGNAANNAAKLAALPTMYTSYITSSVYKRLNSEAKFNGEVDMWKDLGSAEMGYKIYGSNYRWGL